VPFPTSDTARFNQRLVLLFVVGVLLLNEPLLSVFSVPAQIGGVPVLYVSLFTIWALLIAVVAYTLHRRPSASSTPASSPPAPGADASRGERGSAQSAA